MPVQTQLQQRRGTAASWTSTNPTLAAGEIGFESDTGKIKIGTGSTAWNALAYTASSTAVTYLFNATGGQTTFTGADANGLTLAYTVGAEQVYLNGVLQVRGSDYTATNGTSIVLASGALVSDVLNVIAYSAMTITDTYTQAQADAKFFQTANATVAGKNAIINGGFDIWQRATSSTTTSGYVAADRWSVFAGGAVTWARESTTVPAGSTYSMKITAGASIQPILYQAIETLNAIQFAGKDVTFSILAQCSVSRSMTIDIQWSASVDNPSGGSWTTLTASSGGSGTAVNTGFTRISGVFAIPSTAKTLFVRIYPSGNIASGVELFIAQAQLELGSIVTPFARAGGTIQGELAACQRYYFRYTSDLGFRILGTGQCFGTTTGAIAFKYPVTMRTRPTALEQTGTASNYAVLNSTGSATACSAVPTFDAATTTEFGWVGFTVASGLTAGNATAMLSNNLANVHLGWSAEL
jgi:hypothetical protein